MSNERHEGPNEEQQSTKLTDVEVRKDQKSKEVITHRVINNTNNSKSVVEDDLTTQEPRVFQKKSLEIISSPKKKTDFSNVAAVSSEVKSSEIARKSLDRKSGSKETKPCNVARVTNDTLWSSSSSKLNKRISTPNSISAAEYSAKELDKSWSCKSCTHHNFSKDFSCFQCNTPKIKISNTDGINDATQTHTPLKISDCCEGDELAFSEGGRVVSATLPTSAFAGGYLQDRTSNSGTSGHNNREFSNLSIYGNYWIDPPVNEADEKWACPLCTFENWPASSKCSMCYTVREIFNCPDSNNVQDTSNNNMDNIENNRVLSESIANSSYAQRLRHRKMEAETRWLDACRGVVVGNIAPVEEYLARGGDPARQLTSNEVDILNRPSAFDVGYTLVHLALRFQHQETLAMLLSHLDGSNTSSAVKRVPSYVAPDLDQDIRNHVMGTIRYGKGSFRCNFSSEIATFTLPAGIQELPSHTLETLYDEILDHDVQKELESGQFINWSSELTVQLNSRLYALWNRSAGDCLLDSVLQATWGIFDKDNRLRQSLANSLRDSASLFYQRWHENEMLLSHMLDFSLDETQCAADWDNLLSVAGQPGSSLEQVHIFALAHIFRRPIIVYSVKFVKSYLGEALGYARYEGVYLPFLWDSSLCWKWPIALGYTRGHFSALVPHEPHCDPLLRASAAQLDGDGGNSRCTYLPLNTVDGNLLPIHFLSQAEVGNEEVILSQWLDVCYTNAGILVARQRIQKRPLLVAQLVEEWLNHYRTLGQMTSTPYMCQSATTCYSSDGDSDND